MAIKPEKFILRCYGYKFGDKPFVGICIDLNIAVQADTPVELKKKMNEAINSYIETVLDTEDKSSIAILMGRRAPFRDRVFYYILKIIVKIKQIPPNFFSFPRSSVGMHVIWVPTLEHGNQAESNI